MESRSTSRTRGRTSPSVGPRVSWARRGPGQSVERCDLAWSIATRSRSRFTGFGIQPTVHPGTGAAPPSVGCEEENERQRPGSQFGEHLERAQPRQAGIEDGDVRPLLPDQRDGARPSEASPTSSTPSSSMGRPRTCFRTAGSSSASTTVNGAFPMLQVDPTSGRIFPGADLSRDEMTLGVRAGYGRRRGFDEFNRGWASFVSGSGLADAEAASERPA